MPELPMTWGTHRVAMAVAHSLAVTTDARQRVIREDGDDGDGPYRFRVLPADACSCILWTECVGPGLNLPCGEQHHACPVHPLSEVGEPCS